MKRIDRRNRKDIRLAALNQIVLQQNQNQSKRKRGKRRINIKIKVKVKTKRRNKLSDILLLVRVMLLAEALVLFQY